MVLEGSPVKFLGQMAITGHISKEGWQNRASLRSIEEAGWKSVHDLVTGLQMYNTSGVFCSCCTVLSQGTPLRSAVLFSTCFAATFMTAKRGLIPMAAFTTLDSKASPETETKSKIASLSQYLPTKVLMGETPKVDLFNVK